MANHVIAHGVDLTDCQRIGRVLASHGQAFLDRVFTAAEQAACLDRADQLPRLSGRFAVKEAVMKMLGTGWGSHVRWVDIETVNIPSGAPQVRLSGPTAAKAASLGIATVLVSISHTDTMAMASVIGLGPDQTRESGR